MSLVLAIRQAPQPSSAVVDDSPAMFASAMSNQDLVSYSCRPLNQEWNLPAAGFSCTNLRQPVVWTSYRGRSSSLR